MYIFYISVIYIPSILYLDTIHTAFRLHRRSPFGSACVLGALLRLQEDLVGIPGQPLEEHRVRRRGPGAAGLPDLITCSDEDIIHMRFIERCGYITISISTYLSIYYISLSISISLYMIYISLYLYLYSIERMMFLSSSWLCTLEGRLSDLSCLAASK